MNATTMDYIAKSYAENIVYDAIMNAAQDSVWEVVGINAHDDGLDLDKQGIKALTDLVYSKVSNTDFTIN